MSDRFDLALELERARRFAALSGPFDPKDALKAAIPNPHESNPDTIVTLAARLALVCDTQAGPAGSQWLMRGTERRWDIDTLQTDGRLADALAWRSEQHPFDEAAQDVVAALRGSDPFSPGALEAIVTIGPELPRDQLERRAYALERAGPAAPAYTHLERLRAVLNQLDDRRRSDTLLAHGLHGREEELRVLSDWLAAAVRTPPVKALFVTGLPGIGKSALLEASVREAAAVGRPPLVIRLDFDRSALDVLDQVGLTQEIGRQLATQLPDAAGALRMLRLKAAGSRAQELKGRGRETIPSDLALALGQAVASSERIVVTVLDTCEVLRGHGETHPRRLFEWLDRLVALGIAPMSVIAAGRGSSLDPIPERIGNRLSLTGLTPDAAARVLDKADLPSAARRKIEAIANGNPLLLRLASAIATQPGKAAAARRFRGSSSLAAAHLYRFLLSRIPDPDLRTLADPGLVVRRINVEVIRDVLAPKLGLRRIGERRARHFLEELEAQNWLLERDPMADGWLRQRPSMRAELVPLLYASKPAPCAKIDRAAAAWFEQRSEPWLAAEGLYHRLQLMRHGGTVPQIDRDVALLFDDTTLAELPQLARDLVLQARGERSTFARGPAARQAAGGPADPRAVKDLQLSIERGDWEEAADIYKRAIEPAAIEPASEPAEAVRTFLWRVGRWQEARRRLDDRDAIVLGDDDIARLRPDDALARLEMRAELTFANVTQRLLVDDHWRTEVQRVVSLGARTDMGGGALGFALRVRGILIERSWRDVDPVRAADELWGLGGSGIALDNTLYAARERLARRVPRAIERMEMQRPNIDRAVLERTIGARGLAVHSPYACTLSLLTRLGDDRFGSHARAVLNALTHSDLWWNGGLAGQEVSARGAPQEPIEVLADLGLVAEWAGAAAFVLRDDDLALVSRSAETWRRTTAGCWAYGEKPGKWAGADHARGLDASLWARVHELLNAADPVAASRSMLIAWAGANDSLPDDIRAQLARLAARAAVETGREEGAQGALAAARFLIGAGTPAAFVPALATLVALRRNP